VVAKGGVVKLDVNYSMLEVGCNGKRLFNTYYNIYTQIILESKMKSIQIKFDTVFKLKMKTGLDH